MYRYRFFIIFSLFLLLNGSAWAQITKSPFTSLGLGDLKDSAPIHQLGMAGVGLSNGDVRFVNFKNPALLTYNAVYTFSAGLVNERREVSSSERSTTGMTGNLDYLALSIPILKKQIVDVDKEGKKSTRNEQVWSSALVLTPFNSVNYRYNYTDRVLGSPDNITLDVTEEGSGGFNQLSWSHGVRVFDGLSLGAKVSYYFSAITTSHTNQVIGEAIPSVYNPTIFQRESVSDFSFSGGLVAKKEIKEDLLLNLGLLYDFEAALDVKRFRTLERRFTTGTVLASDTLTNNEGSSIVLPASLNLGFSVVKKFKWSVGLDIRQRDWSEFVDFDGNPEGLKNSTLVALGGEWTPDILSVNSYLKRVTYRLGMSMEQLPYVVNGQQVEDFGINFGWSLPVSNISSLDMAFRVGQRGNVDTQLIKENYFRIHLGLTFNDRSFGKQRKYD